LGVAVAFELDGELVGTIRAVPIGYGLTLVEKLRAQSDLKPSNTYAGGWEMGRLVVSREYRGGSESLRGFLYLALSFLNSLSPVANLHAACTPALARLYRRFGLEVVARDVPLHGTAKSYCLIHGAFPRVIGALSDADEQSGWAPVLLGRTVDAQLYSRALA
jgi:hypothetical protein